MYLRAFVDRQLMGALAFEKQLQCTRSPPRILYCTFARSKSTFAERFGLVEPCLGPPTSTLAAIAFGRPSSNSSPDPQNLWKGPDSRCYCAHVAEDWPDEALGVDGRPLLRFESLVSTGRVVIEADFSSTFEDFVLLSMCGCFFEIRVSGNWAEVAQALCP